MEIQETKRQKKLRERQERRDKVTANRKLREEKKSAIREFNCERIIERKLSNPSKGEQRIIDFLEANDIPYIREYFFKQCKLRKSQALLFFDFYLHKHKIAIEFDGQHHFIAINGNEETLKYQKYRDKIKDNFCKRKGIKMVRIDYKHIRNTETMIADALKCF